MAGRCVPDETGSLSTVLDLVGEMRTLGPREALRFDNGYRTWIYSYRQQLDQIGLFQRFLLQRGLAKDSRVLLWSENRPEWVFAFWACLLQGVQLVPLDGASDVEFVARIAAQSSPDLILHGELPEAAELPDAVSLGQVEAITGGPERVDSFPSTEIGPDDIVQILYTSGTTGEPTGVLQRHRNLTANLEPFRREFRKYSALARPFQPIRFLTLLPLSHMFGQAIGLFIPILMGGATVLISARTPPRIRRAIRRHKVSMIGLVPGMLEGIRNEVSRTWQISAPVRLGSGWTGAVRRWWKYRALHRALGWKCWAFVVGGARVSVDLECFWRNLGFVVVQGYGLTETSPVVAVNHPFRSRAGALGKAVAGQEIKLAPDGEILVRGESVASQRLTSQGEVEPVTRAGWLHTGDLGRVDEEGWLYFLGRKKEVIVTSAGMNVYPEDVEEALRSLEGVRDAAVVGLEGPSSAETVHAVLVMEPEWEASARESVIQANRKLQDYQRIQGFSVWREEDLPRTTSTGKIRRHQVARVLRGESPPGPARPDRLAGLMRAGEHGEASRLKEDLGLSSLDRIELLSELASETGVHLSESQMAEASTVGDLHGLLTSQPRVDSGDDARESVLPRLANTLPARLMREAFCRLLVLPIFHHFMDLSRDGGGFVEGLDGSPAIFAPNHCSHLDTLALLAGVEHNRRFSLSPAVRLEYFQAYWDRGAPLGERLGAGVQFVLGCFLLNLFPLPQRLGGIDKAMQYAGRLAERGQSIVIYPEGRRSPDGALGVFKPGVGLMARRLGLPIVPVWIDGTFQSLPPGASWPRGGPIRVRFGEPIRVRENESAQSASDRVRRSVVQLSRRDGRKP